MNKHVLLKEMSTFYILHKPKLLEIEFKTRPGVDKVPFRLTKEQCSAGLFHHDLMSYLHGRPACGLSCTEFVYPGFWNFDNGATTSKIDDVLN